MPSLFRNKFLSIMPWHNCVRNRLCANVAAATCCWSLSLVLLLLLSLRFRTDKTVLLSLRFRTDKTVLLSLRFRTDKLPQDVASLGWVPLFQQMFKHPLKRSLNSIHLTCIEVQTSVSADSMLSIQKTFAERRKKVLYRLLWRHAVFIIFMTRSKIEYKEEISNQL